LRTWARSVRDSEAGDSASVAEVVRMRTGAFDLAVDSVAEQYARATGDAPLSSFLGRCLKLAARKGTAAELEQMAGEVEGALGQPPSGGVLSRLSHWVRSPTFSPAPRCLEATLARWEGRFSGH
jgi:hypothetical protein